jgi:hypothetical protein
VLSDATPCVVIGTHKRASKTPAFIYQNLRRHILEDRDVKNMLSDVRSVLKIKTWAYGITLFDCVFVSVCSTFKLLTHLTEGNETWYENHAIGQHPNIALLYSNINSLQFVIINVLVQQP